MPGRTGLQLFLTSTFFLVVLLVGFLLLVIDEFHPRSKQSAVFYAPLTVKPPNVTRDVVTLDTRTHVDNGFRHKVNNLSEPCCSFLLTKTVEEICTREAMLDQSLVDIGKKCTCVDLLYCRIVVVTAFSNNHHDEAMDFIASVQRFMPGIRIIVYDLGLTATKKEFVSSLCNVELRHFRFEDYPAHVRNLMNYSWKVILLKEVAKEYEVILWGDASVRIHSGAMKDGVLPFLLKFPFVDGPNHPWPIISITRDEMLRYLDFKMTREEARKKVLGTVQATCFVMWMESKMRMFLEHWLDCALHVECMAPAGSKIGCDMNLLHRRQFANCHRYDQSALNVLLLRDFGLDIWLLVQKASQQDVWFIDRTVTHYYTSTLAKCA